MDFKKLQPARTAAVIATTALAFVGTVHADAVDASAIVTDIKAQAGPIALVGGAVLLIFVGVKAFQWVRKALS